MKHASMKKSDTGAKNYVTPSGLQRLKDEHRFLLTRDTALTEAGAQVAPTRHDILTGSNSDGTLFTRGDATCRGWTSLGEGRAMVGHHNRSGGGQGDSWNAAHLSRGCSQAALRASLGDGLLYCFAAD